MTRSRLEIEAERVEAQRELARLSRLQVDLPGLIADEAEHLLALSEELLEAVKRGDA